MFASILGSKAKRIDVLDRRTGKTFVEKVFSEDAMRIFYGHPAGIIFTKQFLTATWVSRLYGRYHDKAASRKKIAPFIEELSIDLKECLEPSPEAYASFNDFFARKLTSDARPIAKASGAVVSPADGRLLAFPRVNGNTMSYVKWAPVPLLELFGDIKDLAERYHDGAACIVRLCPSDYHRFHFPVSGKAHATRTVEGFLHSVSPYALEQKVPVFCLNKRTLCEIDSPEFGKVLFMEIGALLVGGIVQTYEPNQDVKAGDEKGFFKFGGSTVIMFFEKNRITFDEDLVANSTKGLETLVRMGEKLGHKV